jgi:hypothetical protein
MIGGVAQSNIIGHQIRDFLGYREATVEDADALSSWLQENWIARDRNVEHLKGLLLERCHELRSGGALSGRQRTDLARCGTGVRTDGPLLSGPAATGHPECISIVLPADANSVAYDAAVPFH